MAVKTIQTHPYLLLTKALCTLSMLPFFSLPVPQSRHLFAEVARGGWGAGFGLAYVFLCCWNFPLPVLMIIMSNHQALETERLLSVVLCTLKCYSFSGLKNKRVTVCDSFQVESCTPYRALQQELQFLLPTLYK